MCYTGVLFEEEVLCKCTWSWKTSGYVPYKKAIAEVRNNQPKGYDPTDPNNPAMNDLHCLLCEELSIEDYSDMKLYTAVGSALDRFHGVDAFFEWQGYVVTIDVKVPSGYTVKANIALSEAELYDSEGKSNVDVLEIKAREIAWHFSR